MPTIDTKPGAVIEVTNISFAYGDDTVLKDITLRVGEGDYLGLIGPNGSGKTTLLKIMLGLLKPHSGSVLFLGRPLSEMRGWSGIGYVPQRASFDKNFPVTVREVVLMGRYARRGLFRFTTKDDEQAVKKALSQVGMLDYQDRLIGSLSGGQQQRVFIARALAAQPTIIFLDEPTVGIDEKSAEEFYALLRTLNQELHLTLVLVSHDIDIVLREVIHVACLNRKLLFYGTPKEFAQKTRLMSTIRHRLHHHA